MNFLYLYDLIDFDENGNVKETSLYDSDKKVASNFLYLICKYNQFLLKTSEKSQKEDEKVELPAFFKENLTPLLQKVEKGETSKEYALYKVSEYCLPTVKKIIEEAKNDEEIIHNLNTLVDIDAQKYSKKFKNIQNNKQREYIMTIIIGNLMEEIKRDLPQVDHDQKDKSSVYKKIISYNGLVSAISKMEKAG